MNSDEQPTQSSENKTDESERNHTRTPNQDAAHPSRDQSVNYQPNNSQPTQVSTTEYVASATPSWGQPQEQPLQQPVYTSNTPAVQPQSANPGLIVLQWLTYAFWGWTVLALSALTYMVVASFVSDAETGGFMPYGIAAVLVLLPISYVCDSFYVKKEPAKKAGAEVWVMVIHAVIFALFGIGSLITAVISGVLLITSSSDSKGSLVSLYSALIIAVYYGLTFLRTLNPAMLHRLNRTYKFVMLLSVGIIGLFGILGPMAHERSTRDDKLVSAEISTLSDSISNYATTNNKLPTDLSVLDLRGDTKVVLDKNLVEYKPESTAAAVVYNTGSSNSAYDSTQSGTTALRYQLCATYSKESSGYSKYSSQSSYADNQGYTTYVSADNHPAGKVCYKLETSGY